MKIYYIASPRGVKEFGNLYKKTYQFIEELGHTHVDDYIVKIDPDKFYEEGYDYRVRHYHRVMKSIKECDVCIVEVSVHSMTMGYIVDRALESGTPVIVLHAKGFDPYFFTGMQNDKLQICEYTRTNIKEVLEPSLNAAQEQLDVRFTMLFPPKMISYLDHISKKKNSPRSAFIRHLIQREMDKDNY